MPFPFSTDELKAVLKTDTGFKNFIASLPQEQGEQIEKIVSDESILLNALNALPLCLNNLACIHLELEDLDQGIAALEDALVLAQQENDPRQEALILNNLALCHLRGAPSDDPIEQASSCIHKAFSNSAQIGSLSLQALSLGNKAFVCQAIGKHNDAEKSFLDAIHLYGKIGSRADEATALIHLASHLKDHLGNMEGAARACRKAINIKEGIRGDLKKEVHRISYAAKEVDAYGLIVACLLALDRPDEALEYVERAKSRALLDFLAGKAIDAIAIETDPEAFQRAVQILAEIDEIQKALTAVRFKGEIDSGTETEREAIHEYAGLSDSLLNELIQKERAFEQAFSELNRLDPDRASILRVSPLTTDRIRDLAGEDTLFLELYQTEERLYLFPVAGSEPVRVVKMDFSVREGMERVQSLMEALAAATWRR